MIYGPDTGIRRGGRLFMVMVCENMTRGRRLFLSQMLPAYRSKNSTWIASMCTSLSGFAERDRKGVSVLGFEWREPTRTSLFRIFDRGRKRQGETRVGNFENPNFQTKIARS